MRRKIGFSYKRGRTDIIHCACMHQTRLGMSLRMSERTLPGIPKPSRQHVIENARSGVVERATGLQKREVGRFVNQFEKHGSFQSLASFTSVERVNDSDIVAARRALYCCCTFFLCIWQCSCYTALRWLRKGPFLGHILSSSLCLIMGGLRSKPVGSRLLARAWAHRYP